jgi:hypothetical protein
MANVITIYHMANVIGHMANVITIYHMANVMAICHMH